jgi:hypothetical protein
MWRYLVVITVLGCKISVIDTDEPCDEADELILYPDSDADGFGDILLPMRSCTALVGYVYNSEDCDDSNASSYPSAVELCDGEDNDCDGFGDAIQTWYPDADGDGFGVPGQTVEDCIQPDGYAGTDDDCDDSSPFIYPGAVDVCDGIDNDCDGDFDEDSKSGWPLVSIDHRAPAVWEVDQTNGALSLISPLSVTDEEIPTMDTRGDGYALVYDSAAKVLMQIDACTGTLTAVGGTSGAGKTCGIAFGPGGALYGLDNSNNALVVFDTQTGLATEVGALGFDLGACGLTYQCSTGTLIGADATTDELFHIDVGTGAASNFIQTDIPFNSVGLEFDAISGMILASTNDAFYQLDPTTGSSTKLGTFPDGTHMNDLAFHPECP